MELRRHSCNRWRGWTDQDLVPWWYAQISGRPRLEAHLQHRLVTRERRDPVLLRQEPDHRANSARQQADPMEGPRRSRPGSGLEPGQQPHRFSRRGLQVQSLGSVRQAAVQLSAL